MGRLGMKATLTMEYDLEDTNARALVEKMLTADQAYEALCSIFLKVNKLKLTKYTEDTLDSLYQEIQDKIKSVQCGGEEEDVE